MDVFLNHFAQRLTDPDAHRSTDYRHWFRAKGPYPVEVFNDKYEPYVVIKKTATTPQFDERFHDGPLARISHIMELLAAGYEFIVLPLAWAITEPSFPTASSESQAYGFFSQTDVYVRRFEFISELMQNYKLGPCEQTEDTMEDSIDDAR
ncbi:hypothetical protein BSL78_30122 [Apostichopus japonicus]|uniref:Uncharacterized protein n=1 Tax=Stichopus japonicus TaxID=307972 RepID=A0A2G8JBE5_STIJA|nr:hypothetical protein BSL78_30122 [Apostichopus japonicus]